MTLNQNNVIHRDIKPDNILYNIVKKDKINIKIIDFN